MAKFDFKKDLSIPYPLGVALSSDGRRVAILESYASWRRNSHLVRLLVRNTADGSAPECVTEGWDSIANLVWGEGDARLCWSGVKKGKALLAIWDAENGRLVRVHPGWTGVDAVAWNTKNRRLLVLARYAGSGGQTTSQTRLVWIGLESKTPVASLAVTDAFNAGALRISPSGKEAVFTGTPGPDHRDQRRHLFLCNFDRNFCSPILCGDNAVFSPTWQGSRRILVYLKRKGAWNDLGGASLHRLHLEGGQEELLCEGLEYASQIIRCKDRTVLLQTQTCSQRLGLHEMAMTGGKMRECQILGSNVAYGFSINHRGRFACVEMSEKTGPEVSLGQAGLPRVRKISDYSPVCRSLHQARRDWLAWQSRDGTTVEGLLVSHPEKAKNKALLVVAHGGPVTGIFDVLFLPYLNRWTPYPIPELIQSGIAVFLPNYRGSAGRGHEFRTGIRRRLGELECFDIVSGIACVRGRMPRKDFPVGVAGWSYGGYLAALLGTKFRSLFSAVSTGAAMIDLDLQFRTGGNNMESYRKPGGRNFLSPLDEIHPDGPPILIQHGEQDTIVPPAHSSLFFDRLKAAGIPAEFITYPGGHVITALREMRRVRENNWEFFCKHLIEDFKIG